ncbi:hypothetical protein HGRIS_005267 [Hohenbuehelia grisea]|uniref:Uncharacterized protein n=1 Tax=Hohenbuehelia grisea TaxID=104357 RepID=A0ABR3JEH0_9AGAR
MTATYSPFFASGLLATSYHAPADLAAAFKPSTSAADLSRASLSRITASSSSLTLVMPSPLACSPSPACDTPTSPRHRRRRSSLSAVASMSALGSIKQSPVRDATIVAARYVASSPSATTPLRARSGSMSFARMIEMSTASCAEPIAEAPVALTEQPKRSRIGTIAASRVPVLRLKRGRRGPSPNPPPTSPLPPVPNVPRD